MSRADKTVGLAAAAASHADLIIRINELTRALVRKGLISGEDIKAALSEDEAKTLRAAATSQFLEDAERMGQVEIPAG
jgi:hypothetical protein